MDEAKRELVQSWLRKAQHDLASARKLAAAPDAYLDTAVYHCQQAAEKAVKGFLTFHDRPFPKTHDLELLLAAAVAYADGLSALEEQAQLLTPYAIRFRYPGELAEPEREEFDEALQGAEMVCSRVISLLPKEVWPEAK
jgi:HEPN domain-containing protein